MERAGRIAEGWITSSRADLTKISEAVGVISEAAAAAGRDPARCASSAGAWCCAGAGATGPRTAAAGLLSGSYPQIREDAAWLG